MPTFLPDGALVIGSVTYESLQQRVEEAIRCAGIAWKREHDPSWRDKPWHDGISVDLDEDDVLAPLAKAAMDAIQEVLL